LFYSELEKIAYAVIRAARKLRHYFGVHKIIVVTDQPLHDLFHNKEASAKINKWASELSEHYIDFEKKVLVDFIVDWTSPTFEAESPIKPWTIHCDGA